MVKVTGSKKLDLFVIHDVVTKEDAEQRIGPYKQRAFGMFSSLINTFNKNRHEIMVSKYLRRYEPFWHIHGESLIKYLRNTTYHVEVKPEVRSVTINGQHIDVLPDKPILAFDAQDHCFEAHPKSILKHASGGSDKKLETYMKAASRKLSSIKEIQTISDTIILEPTVKVSMLVRDLVRDLIKPVEADKILEENVTITTISLYFHPIHVFELIRESKTAQLEVDGVTGGVSTSSPLKEQIAQKLRHEQTWFDIGTELASTIIPGAGVGVILTKHVKDKYAEKKQMEAMKLSVQAKSKLNS